MAWARLDDTFDTHPKVLALGSDARRWTWARVLLYTTRYRSPIVPPNVTESVPKATRKFLADCLELGLLDRTAGGELEVHDWEQYQGSDSRLQVKERVRRYRERNAPGNGDVTDGSVTPALLARRRDTRPVPSYSSSSLTEGSTDPTPSETDDLDLTPPEIPTDQEAVRYQAWHNYAEQTAGIRNPGAYARTGYASGDWPPELTSSTEHEPRAPGRDDSKTCTNCGETYGQGHLETCPRITKPADDAASEA